MEGHDYILGILDILRIVGILGILSILGTLGILGILGLNHEGIKIKMLYDMAGHKGQLKGRCLGLKPVGMIDYGSLGSLCLTIVIMSFQDGWSRARRLIATDEIPYKKIDSHR